VVDPSVIDRKKFSGTAQFQELLVTTGLQ